MGTSKNPGGEGLKFGEHLLGFWPFIPENPFDVCHCLQVTGDEMRESNEKYISSHTYGDEEPGQNAGFFKLLVQKSCHCHQAEQSSATLKCDFSKFTPIWCFSRLLWKQRKYEKKMLIFTLSSFFLL